MIRGLPTTVISLVFVLRVPSNLSRDLISMKNERNNFFLLFALGVLLSAAASVSAQDESAVGGTISGMVFQDKNENAVKDPGEIGSAAVVVELLDEDGDFVARIVTGDDGTYEFEGLTDGVYFLRFEFSAGYGIRSEGMTVGGVGAVVFTPIPFMYPTSRYDFVKLGLSNPASFRGSEVSSFAP